MEIEVEGKLSWHSDSIVERLVLTIKFKENGKWFRTKEKRTLTSTWWINNDIVKKSYISKTHFQEDCIDWLTNDDRLVELVKKIVKSKINRTSEEAVIIDNATKIQDLLKNKEKFNMKVKL